jgi:hypothetical protein
LGGAQSLHGIKPDLTCLGKVMGGGMPMAAFGGRTDIMNKLAPLGNVYQAGTLSGNPLAVAAGLANLDIITQPGFYDCLATQTKKFVNGMQERANQARVPFSVDSVGGMFGLYFSKEVPTSYAAVTASDIEAFKKFFHLMLDNGVYLAPSAYEAGFLGNLGVNGLTVHYFQNANADFTNRFRSVKAEGKNMGAKYNFGSFTVAANKKLSQAESFANNTSGAVGEITEKAYSVAYAVNKDLSVGVLVADASRSYAGDPTTGAGSDLVDGRGKQKLKAINVGYALGPVNLAVGYAKNTDVSGTNGSDTEVFMARLIGAF